jgi:hypothetical protein
MYSTQVPFVQLFEAVASYRGSGVYSQVLLPQGSFIVQISTWLDDFRHRTKTDWSLATAEDLSCLYALSRLTSLLLLRFQKVRADGTDYLGPEITIEDFLAYHLHLGFKVHESTGFHPIVYEIGEMRTLEDDLAPLVLLDINWPCLTLDNLIYCRGNVNVQSGSSYATKNVAESSKMYWAYRRKDRAFADQSHGWGHNSQWRTAFRRDYINGDDFCYNVDGVLSLNNQDCDCDGIPRETLIELVRNRCLIKTQIDDSDLYPYSYRYTEKA